MTLLICSTIAVVGGVGIIVLKPESNDPYAECYNFFGVKDTECAAAIARDRIMNSAF